MPSFNTYKLFNSSTSNGAAKIHDSNTVMEYTWKDSPESQTAYLYDWYHDDYKTTLDDLHPASDSNKTAIDIKYLMYSSQTYSKDTVTKHIQLRPSQTCNISYYDIFFANRYHATFPVGLYIDIVDTKGKYNKWLVVDKANGEDLQFPTYEILRCDYVVDAIIDGKKYYFPSVLRSQNSQREIVCAL